MTTEPAAPYSRSAALDWALVPALALASLGALSIPAVGDDFGASDDVLAVLRVLGVVGTLGVVALWAVALRSGQRSTASLVWLGVAALLTVGIVLASVDIHLLAAWVVGWRAHLLTSVFAVAAATVGWFLLRGLRRLPLLWLLLLLPTAVVTFFAPMLLVAVAAIVIGPLIAVSLAVLTASFAPASAAATADADLARRAAEITRWEEAYALAHNGEKPPAGYVPPVTAAGTNNFALAALIVGIIQGGVLAVVFGHIGLAQVRRTGEQGRGFAIAGLVLGYVSLAATIALLLFFVVLRGLL